ncbi:MAG: hypothetical protein R2939_08995 [Kofleriaceae bacterium]
MKRQLAIFSSALAVACGGSPSAPPATPKEPVVTDSTPPVDDSTPPAAPTDADVFLAACRADLARAKGLLPTILGAQPKTIASTLEPYNDLLISLGAASASSSLTSEVHPDAAVRDAARVCEQETSSFGAELGLNRPLYDALAAVDVSGADANTQRFLERTLRDFRRSGVDRDDATRARLQAIDEEIAELGQAFQKVLGEDVGEIRVDPAELEGLPADYVAARPPGADGKVRITTDYPDLIPFA